MMFGSPIMNSEDSLEMFSCIKPDTSTTSELMSAGSVGTTARIIDNENHLVKEESNESQQDVHTFPVFFSGKSYVNGKPLKELSIKTDPVGTFKDSEIAAELSPISENITVCTSEETSSGFSSTTSHSRVEGELETEVFSSRKRCESQVEGEGRHSEVHDFVRRIESQFGNICGRVIPTKRLKSCDSYGEESTSLPSSSNGESSVTWFSCDKCHLEFSSRKSLANHAKTHPKLMVIKNTCVYCGAKSDNPKGLSNHLLREHLYDVSNFACESCQLECISADLFDKHQYSCHRKEGTHSLICSVCDKVYYDNDIFDYHKTQQKQCHICCLTFCMTSHQFKVHKEKHTLYKYSCDHCNASFVTKASLTKHLDSELPCAQKCKDKEASSSIEENVDSNETSIMKVDKDPGSTDQDRCKPSGISGGPDEREKCLLCPAEFVHLKNLWRHVAVVHQEDIQGVDVQHLPQVKCHRCTICDKVFTRNSSLVSHMASHIDKSFSERDGKPQCTVCQKTFQAKRYLVDHMKLHSDNQTYVCQFCNRKFLRRSHLKLHVEIHNNNKKFFGCPHCKKSYTKKKDQVQHIRQKHSNPTGKDLIIGEGFQCPTCNKHFATALKLRMHKIYHTVSKPPYTCLECSKSFPSLNTLKRHYLVHWDVRPFTCSVCSRAFRHSQSLKRHMTTHTGEKPYSCNHCGKSFSLKGTLNCHMHIHSSQRTLTCYKCNGNFVSKRKMKLHTCCIPSQEHNDQEEVNVTEKQSYTPYTNLQTSIVIKNTADNSISHMINNGMVNSIEQVTDLLGYQGLNAANPNPVSNQLTLKTVTGDFVPVVNDLVPVSNDISVGKLSSSGVVPLSESGSSTSVGSNASEHQTPFKLPVKKESGSVAVYQNGILMERSSSQTTHLPSYQQNDVLSQAFAVMGDDLMQDCVNLNTCSVLEAKPGISIGPETTVYTFVKMEGEDPQQTLISIPTVSSGGTEENVTLQINLSDDCSEVFIIES